MLIMIFNLYKGKQLVRNKFLIKCLILLIIFCSPLEVGGLVVELFWLPNILEMGVKQLVWNLSLQAMRISPYVIKKYIPNFLPFPLQMGSELT